MSVVIDIASATLEKSEKEVIEFLQKVMFLKQVVQQDTVKKLAMYQRIKFFLLPFNIDGHVASESGYILRRRNICKIWGDERFDEEQETASTSFDLDRSNSTNIL